MNDRSLYGWRLIASAILGAAAGITAAIALTARGNDREAVPIVYLLAVAAFMMLPTVFESFVIAVRAPLFFLRNVYVSSGVTMQQRVQK